MSLILEPSTRILIQGITGKEGQRGLEFMKHAGSHVVAGVTPGKGGEVVDGVPVYSTVAEALSAHPQITATSLFVPPKFVLSAVKEALETGLKVIHIFAEGVPLLDTSQALELAAQHQARIIGPSSIGLYIPGKVKLGSLGGTDLESFLPVTNQPGVAVLSKSGGLAKEIAAMLTRAQIPQSLALGIGGDQLIGTSFADMIPDLTNDQNTGAVVIMGEIGGSYEEDLAEAIKQHHFTKPVVAFISGLFAETLPQGVSFGHAGAIVSKSVGTRQGKIKALQGAGVIIVETPTQIPDQLTAFALQ